MKKNMEQGPIKTGSNLTWDEYFMNITMTVSMKSKDQSTRTGAVIVGPDHEIRSTCFNGLPRGMDDSNPEHQERPMKYKFFEHAERNAVFNAARFGASLLGCTIYCYWPPCTDCARAIIQAGIVRSVSQIPISLCPERWHEDMKIAQKMLHECGVLTSHLTKQVKPFKTSEVPRGRKVNILELSINDLEDPECCRCSRNDETCSCCNDCGPEKVFFEPKQQTSGTKAFEAFLVDILGCKTFDNLKSSIAKQKTQIPTTGPDPDHKETVEKGRKDQTGVAGVDFAPKDHVKEDKPRPTLIPFDLYTRYLADMNNIKMTDLPFDIFLQYMTTAYEEGIIKYFRESWRNGFPVSVMVDAALRHITEFFWNGNDYDMKAPTRKHHLSGAIFSLTCILQTLETRPELDDRKKNNG